MRRRRLIGPDFFLHGIKKEPNFATMKLALGLDVQTNAKGGKFMSIKDSHQGALVCKVDVEVLWEPGNFQDDGAKRVGGAGGDRQHDRVPEALPGRLSCGQENCRDGSSRLQPGERHYLGDLCPQVRDGSLLRDGS